MQMAKRFFCRRMSGRVIARLRPLLQGESPRRLAMGLALGVTLGVAPLAWGTTLLCVALALILRLPPVVVQAGNYAVFPLQVTLFVPFLTAGQFLMAPRQCDVLAQVRQTLSEDPLICARLFWQVNLRGLLVWLAISPLLLWAVYRLTYRLLSPEAY